MSVITYNPRQFLDCKDSTIRGNPPIPYWIRFSYVVEQAWSISGALIPEQDEDGITALFSRLRSEGF